MVLKVHDNQQEAAKPAAPAKETVTDSKGRVITLRQLDPLQQARLVMAVGGALASNQPYMSGFAMPAAMVALIDDVPYALPQNIPQVESVLQILGNEGMAAIGAYLLAKFKALEEEADKAVLSAEQAAAKN